MSRCLLRLLVVLTCHMNHVFGTYLSLDYQMDCMRRSVCTLERRRRAFFDILYKGVRMPLKLYSYTFAFNESLLLKWLQHECIPNHYLLIQCDLVF